MNMLYSFIKSIPMSLIVQSLTWNNYANQKVWLYPNLHLPTNKTPGGDMLSTEIDENYSSVTLPVFLETFKQASEKGCLPALI